MRSGADLQLQIFKRPEVAKALASWRVVTRKKADLTALGCLSRSGPKLMPPVSFGGGCLRQSLVLYHALAYAGFPVEFHVDVRKLFITLHGQASRTFNGHSTDGNEPQSGRP